MGPRLRARLSGEKFQTWVCRVRRPSRLGTTNLSHLSHLSPFPGQPCACAGTTAARFVPENTTTQDPPAFTGTNGEWSESKKILPAEPIALLQRRDRAIRDQRIDHASVDMILDLLAF